MQVVQAVANNLGDGTVIQIPVKDGFLEEDFDYFKINIRFQTSECL
jgi:hypothetical protein